MGSRAVTVLSDSRVVCESCELADTPWRRLRGLMGRAGLEPRDGMLVTPTSSIHTSFMRFPIDAIFLDPELRILRIQHHLRPWRVAAARGARSVLELAAGAGELYGLVPGVQLQIAEGS